MQTVVSDWKAAPLTPIDRALCEYAAKLTHHQHQMRPTDLDRLRTHGVDDTAIHDATQIVAYFNYITRIADALGVEPEDFIQAWGSGRAADGGDSD